LQGKPEEEKKWSIPSGGKETHESFEACCIREVLEETGYEVMIKREVYRKETTEVEVAYFKVAIVGGQMIIADPDELIYEIAWKTKEEINGLTVTYPAP
jgi:8-oxo-dGTP pyrophosphatase MutT (NUDIX family)